MKRLHLKKLISNPITGEWGKEGGETPVIRTTNFTKTGKLNLKKVVLRDIQTKKVESKRLIPGDIIIEKSGGSPTQPVGRVAFFDKEGLYLCNNFTSVLRPKKEVIFPKYLHYQLFALHQFGLTSGFQNKTTGIINLQLKRYVDKVKIPLPPLSTQKKIAAILDAADAYRQKTKALIDKYDELAQSLFLDMFGDPVTNPKGWEKKTIEDVTKREKGAIKRGPFGGALKKEIFVEKGYLVYEQYHALNNDFSFARYFIDKKKFEELKGFAVQPGDVIISCSGVYLGKLAIIPDDAKEGIINQALLKITLDESKMTNRFFTFHFRQENFRNAFFEANRGAGIPNFPPMKEFKKFPFIVPPIEIQIQFESKIQSIMDQRKNVMGSVDKSEDLFNSLLQRAFKGELV